jgi:hypothetical protein
MMRATVHALMTVSFLARMCTSHSYPFRAHITRKVSLPMLLSNLVLALHNPLLKRIPNIRILPQPIDLILSTRDLQSLLHLLSTLNALSPLLQARELSQLDPRPRRPSHPGKSTHVRNAVLPAILADQILTVTETLFQHGVEALGLVLVAIDAVLNLLGCVSVEMVRLRNSQSLTTQR